MYVERITVQGQGRCNEDGLIEVVEKGLYGVIDGVSGLHPYQDEQGMTSGIIAASVVLETMKQVDEEGDLVEQSLIANNQLRQMMQDRGIDLTKKDHLWGAAHAVIRISEHTIEWVQSGDCMIYAVYADARIREVTHDSVAEHDQRALDLWQEQNYIKIEGKFPEQVREQLLANRRLANTPGGYSVINSDPDLAYYLESGKIARNGLGYLLLVTDGIYGFGECQEGNRFVQAIINEGLKSYTNRLCRFEQEDAECRQVVRFKQLDDKTGILIRF